MKRLGWAVWVLGLLAAPIGLLIVDFSYPDIPSYPPPWPSERSEPHRLAEGLGYAHLILSGIVLAATPFLTRRLHMVIIAWIGIAVLAFAVALMTLDIIMAKTGFYL